ncbi:MAG: hypothetical protein A3G37_01105 [Omnitrophica WOR_2 bacterium RIFCSPLOWO2_12_FULL_46_30]|nr:MAG: hypothetical protein A3H41_03295 [Omnitrophica WOR_2 bacterium RIFCSPLOWO2_02_FULL_45_28]OGX51742.1 MAG: hypothetical protein A3G37_01105 [Omnitrophica WOR_2 bacterium RIFCSPLOWO2_12_FULL_46_30]
MKVSPNNSFSLARCSEHSALLKAGGAPSEIPSPAFGGLGQFPCPPALSRGLINAPALLKLALKELLSFFVH